MITAVDAAYPCKNVRPEGSRRVPQQLYLRRYPSISAAARALRRRGGDTYVLMYVDRATDATREQPTRRTLESRLMTMVNALIKTRIMRPLVRVACATRRSSRQYHDVVVPGYVARSAATERTERATWCVLSARSVCPRRLRHCKRAWMSSRWPTRSFKELSEICLVHSISLSTSRSTTTARHTLAPSGRILLRRRIHLRLMPRHSVTQIFQMKLWLSCAVFWTRALFASLHVLHADLFSACAWILTTGHPCQSSTKVYELD